FAATVRESFSPLVRVQDAGADELFGADDNTVIFRPSRREYAERRVHRPALADDVATALVQQRFACVLGKGASGKTTLALLLAFDAEFGVYRTFYYDLTENNDEQPDPEKYRALMVGIANQHGREALVIIDNVHLAERLSMCVYNAWRDAGMPVRLLFQGRLTEKVPDSRGRQSVFAEIGSNAMRLVVQKQDLVGVIQRLMTRQGKSIGVTVPDAALAAWQRLFEGDLIAFSFAAQSKLSQFSRGNFTLSADDASRYVREYYLQNVKHPLSMEERENLLMLAACAELEFSVSERGMPYPGKLGFGIAHGLVWQSLHGRSGQYQRSRLHHPGMGKLLWQAAKPVKPMLEYQCEFSSRDPHDGFSLAIRYQRVLADSDGAGRILDAAVSSADAFAQVIENGIGTLKIPCELLLRLGVITLVDLDSRIATCPNLAAAMWATPLGDLRNFLDYAQSKLPKVFDALVGVLESQRAELARAALATPLHFLRNFLEYAQLNLPKVFDALVGELESKATELARAALATPLHFLRNFLEYAQLKLPKVFDALVGELESQRAELTRAALATPLHILRNFLEYAQSKLPKVFDALVGDLESQRAELARAALATPLDHLRNFLEYAKAELPEIWLTLNHSIEEQANLAVLVKVASSTDFAKLSGFLRAGGALSVDVVNAVYSALAVEFRAQGISHPRLQAVRANLDLLVPADVVLGGSGCHDLIEELAVQIIREADHASWQRSKNAMPLLTTLLRLARRADDGALQHFLQKTVTTTWLDRSYKTLAPQQISVALYSLWIWSPHYRRFVVDSLQLRASRLVWNMHSFDEDAKAIGAFELFGACTLFNVDVVQEKIVWPTQQQLNKIFALLVSKLGTEYLGPHPILFLLGLRAMVRVRRDTLTFPTESGERILTLWHANQSENANHVALNSWMISWLERCKGRSWKLSRDNLPLPKPIYEVTQKTAQDSRPCTQNSEPSSSTQET
ncbi:MAG: hypothetical protein RL748_667, partial [Pseudomonadota bacterium]